MQQTHGLVVDLQRQNPLLVHGEESALNVTEISDIHKPYYTVISDSHFIYLPPLQDVIYMKNKGIMSCASIKHCQFHMPCHSVHTHLVK